MMVLGLFFMCYGAYKFFPPHWHGQIENMVSLCIIFAGTLFFFRGALEHG